MSKFQVGQQVIRTKLRFNNFKEGIPYLVTKVTEDDCIEVEGFPDGTLWDEDYFELYQEPAQKTFNPKPGDVIVTNNGKKYKYMSREEYCRFGGFSTDYYKDYTIFGWDITAINPQYFQHMRWLRTDGKASCDHGFDIKEIIPASSNNPVAISQQPQDLSFQVKALELENQMLRMLLRREGVEV